MGSVCCPGGCTAPDTRSRNVPARTTHEPVRVFPAEADRTTVRAGAAPRRLRPSERRAALPNPPAPPAPPAPAAPVEPAPEPDPKPANPVKLQVKERWTGSTPLLAGGILALAGLIVIGIAWSAIDFGDNQLRSIREVTNTVDGKATAELTKVALANLAPARLAIVVLLGLGWLVICCGITLALGEATVPVEAEKAPDNRRELDAGGLGAVVVAIGETAKALGAALKDLRSATAAMVVGALLMITGAGVAWQTIPGTDTNPTISTGSTESSTPASSDPSTPASSDPSTPASSDPATPPSQAPGSPATASPPTS